MGIAREPGAGSSDDARRMPEGSSHLAGSFTPASAAGLVQDDEYEMIGSSLSHYKITAKLGQGGMGEVYRATDDNLGRNVAIKVLPEEVAGDADRLARFKREAHLLGSLNHTNIASIYGLEEADGKPFLVLELVEGEDLSERLKRGPIPVDEALDIAKQIAAALEEAHERGIVHRDLKPANVKVTPGGRVKVLDFGLAKAYAGDSPDGSAPHVSQSPTMSAQATQAGVILGTAAYMSPEQARGKPVDKRADIWALGVVLFEMLTGNHLFEGETVSDVLAAVLRQEIAWDRLPASSAGLRRLLRRCLERDPRQRLHDIADVRLELEEIGDPDRRVNETTDSPRPAAGGLARVALGAALVISGIAVGFALATRSVVDRGPSGPVRFVITPEAGAGSLESLRISPDGRSLVYSTESGPLRLRHLDAFETTNLPGTNGASLPFWSPDSDWIGFYLGGKIRKVSVDGGDPSIICDAPQQSPGAGWGPNGIILFSPTWTGTGLWQVDPDGGTPKEVTTPDRARGETGHFWPDFLPGGGAALFTVFAGRGLSDSSVAVLDLETREHDVLFAGARPQYLASGHVLFFRDGAYFAVPFDAARRVVTGEARPLPGDARPLSPTGSLESYLDLSDTGVLATVPGELPQGVSASRYSWLDRDGQQQVLGFEGSHRENFSLSPDGTQLAVSLYAAGEFHIWVYNLEYLTRQRLTREGLNFSPGWHPDGRHVVFVTQRRGHFDVMQVRADGSTEPRLLRDTDSDEDRFSWAPDGLTAIFTVWSPATGTDLWTWIDGEDNAPHPVLQTPALESEARFSPDGRSLAFASDGSLMVAGWPEMDRRVQIARQTTRRFRWSRSSDELFYMADGKLHAARYTTRGDAFHLVGTAPLFDVPAGNSSPDFDVSADAQRFLFQVHTGEPPVEQIRVTVNFDGLK